MCLLSRVMAFAAVLVICLNANEAMSATKSAVVSSQTMQKYDSLVVKKYSELPLAFEKNEGQTDGVVDFIARGPGYRVFLARGEAVVTVTGEKSGRDAQRIANTMRMHFVGARQDIKGTGIDVLPGKTNYFIGQEPSQHFVDIANYKKVVYESVYPGTDLVYYGNQRQLEYDFIVSPGGDPRNIRLAFDGIKRSTIDTKGNLILAADEHDFVLRRPDIYQIINGKRKKVAGGYAKEAHNEIGFRIAAYDANEPLIIDPVLGYSTYLGGTGMDFGTAIAVDDAGNVYVAGYTSSTDFPMLSAYKSRLGRGDTDAFVSKINSSGSSLIYSTYLGGGNGKDYATGIAVQQGNAYITGVASTDFPTTTGAYQTSAPLGWGGFVTKLSAGGNSLVYSTLLSDVSWKNGTTGIAVDSGGHAYIVGNGTPSFSTTPGAFQTTSAVEKAFVAKLNPTGTGMVYASFLGGSGTTLGRAIAVDADGYAFVGGSTTSADFPIVNALQSALRSQGTYSDGFVTKFDQSGSSLIFSTYLGGTMDDSVRAIAIDGDGNAYAAGETYSSDFPIKNAFQREKGGKKLVNSILGNGFVAKLHAAGDSLAYSSFLGGDCLVSCSGAFGLDQTPGDAAYAIAVDMGGHAYVTGIARSYTFPLTDVIQPRKVVDQDDSLFVTKVSVSGNALLYSALLRTGYAAWIGPLETGVPNGAGNAIAVGSAGSVYVASENDSSSPYFSTTAGALQQTLVNGADVIIFKLDATSSGFLLSSSMNPVNSSSTVTLTATPTDPSLTGTVTFLDGTSVLGTVAIANGSAVLTKQLTLGIHRLTAILRSSTATADSTLLYQVAESGLVCN